MKKFLSDILLTALFGLFFIIVSDLIALKANNPFKEKYNNLIRNCDSIEILLVGNSHIAQNVDEEILGPDCCNMAMGGSGGRFPKDVAEKFVPLLSNLNTLIINLDYIPEIDSSKLQREPKPIDLSWNKKMIFLHSAYWDVYDGLNNKSAFLNDQTKSFITGTDIYLVGLLEDTTYESTWWNSNKLDKISVEEYEEKINIITSLAKLCKQNSIRFIVITTPASDEFCSKTQIHQIQIMHHIMDSISTIYPLEYGEYLCDGEFRDLSYYSDYGHLNHRGATLFTKRVKKDFNL